MLVCKKLLAESATVIVDCLMMLLLLLGFGFGFGEVKALLPFFLVGQEYCCVCACVCACVRDALTHPLTHSHSLTRWRSEVFVGVCVCECETDE